MHLESRFTLPFTNRGLQFPAASHFWCCFTIKEGTFHIGKYELPPSQGKYVIDHLRSGGGGENQKITRFTTDFYSESSVSELKGN